MKNIQSKKKQKSYYHQHKKTKYSHLRFLALTFFMLILSNSLYFLKPQISSYTEKWFKKVETPKMATATQTQLIVPTMIIAPQTLDTAPILNKITVIDTLKKEELVLDELPRVNQKPEHQTQPMIAVSVKLETQPKVDEDKIAKTPIISNDTIVKIEKTPKINGFLALCSQYKSQKVENDGSSDHIEFTQLLENIAQYPKNKKQMYQELDNILSHKEHTYFKQAGQIKQKLSQLVR
jgi:hypothetical protein